MAYFIFLFIGLGDHHQELNCFYVKIRLKNLKKYLTYIYLRSKHDLNFAASPRIHNALEGSHLETPRLCRFDLVR